MNRSQVIQVQRRNRTFCLQKMILSLFSLEFILLDMKTQAGTIVRQINKSPLMFEDEDGDLVVERSFIMMGLLVNYTRPTINKKLDQITRPDEKLIDIGMKMGASRCPQYEAYHLMGPIVEIFRDELQKSRQETIPIDSKTFDETPPEQLPENLSIKVDQGTLIPIRTGEDLPESLQKKIDYFDTIVAHLIYRDRRTEPKKVHSTFVLN